ncbi:MAG: trypsin-like peptidase domain-containing protein [Patescibacteria group bacterium]|nr:trypsin-like peptidase domain-containing protein [Patescibacteria group bacterium]
MTEINDEVSDFSGVEKVRDEKSDNCNYKISKKALIGVLVLTIAISTFLGGIAGFLASETSVSGLRGAVEALLPQDVTQQQARELTSATKAGTVKVLEEESSVIKVVEDVSPAVVSIIVSKDVSKLDEFALNPFFDDPFFNPFGLRPLPQGEPETEKREIGGGTGFVVSSDGFIITNRHVVDDLEADYTVVMNDGQKIEAKVLARDTVMDLAVIKVEKNDLPIIELGDSDVLKIGQTVVAIGNSLGEFRNTVSKGIISGLKRNVNAGDGFGQTELLEEVIQTDAAINPGNSGGPILNLQGQVVGVNVAMAQGAENIGFAIPINEVKKIYQSVKTTGKIVRPYLGVRYMLVNEQVKTENNLPVVYGALIVRGNRPSELAVSPGGPADKAGIVENDIVLEINGTKIDQDNDLAKVIKKLNVGDQISMKILTKGEEKSVTVLLEEAN